MCNAAMCQMNHQPQASAGRHSTCACHTSAILSADVSVVTSAFCVFIASLIRRIRKYYIRLQDTRMLRVSEFRII